MIRTGWRPEETPDDVAVTISHISKVS